MKENKLKVEKVPTDLFAYAVMLSVGLIAYINSFHVPFQFDDGGFIEHNPKIFDITDLKEIWQAYPSPTRFISFYSFALNYHFNGLDVFGYHVVNFFIHLAAAFLVRWLVLLTLSTEKFINQPLSANKDIVALFVGLMFLTHPMETQAVTYITQRFASLATMFYVGSLCFYIKGRLAQVSHQTGSSYFLLAFVMALAGMLTKETVFTLPFAVIVYEWYFLRNQGESLERKNKGIIYFCVCLILLALIIPAGFSFDFKRIILSHQESHSHSGDIVTSSKYLLTQFRVLLTYLRLLFFPYGQNLDYDYPVSESLWEPRTFLSLLVHLAILAAALKMRLRQPLISFGILWFYLTAAVESSVIPIRHVIFEHRAYLPSVGFFIAFSCWLFNMTKTRRNFIYLLSAIIVVYSVLTYERNKVWQSPVRLWEDCVKKSPRKARIYNNLAVAYRDEGEFEKAYAAFQKSLELDPHYYETYNNMAEMLAQQGKLDQAIELLEKSLSLKPEASELILNNLGLVYLQKGDLVRAKEMFIQVAQSGLGYVQGPENLAKVYIREGNFAKAIYVYEQMRQEFPHAKNILYNLVDLYLETQQDGKAIKIGQLMLKELKDASLLTQAGSLFAIHQHSQIAIDCFQQSLRLNPRHIDTYLELGKLYGNYEKFDKAIEIWRKGLQFAPNDKRFAELIQQAQQLQAR